MRCFEFRRVVELFFFRRAGEGGNGRLAPLNHRGDVVEIAGADFALMFDGGEAFIGGSKFFLL